MNIKILRKSALINKTGLSKSGIYNEIQEGEMVPPVKLGPRMSGWPEHEIDAILAARIQGQSKDEIKALVSYLIEQRKEITKIFTGNISPNTPYLQTSVVKDTKGLETHSSESES